MRSVSDHPRWTVFPYAFPPWTGPKAAGFLPLPVPGPSAVHTCLQVPFLHRSWLRPESQTCGFSLIRPLGWFRFYQQILRMLPGYWPLSSIVWHPRLSLHCCLTFSLKPTTVLEACEDCGLSQGEDRSPFESCFCFPFPGHGTHGWGCIPVASPSSLCSFFGGWGVAFSGILLLPSWIPKTLLLFLSLR